MSNDKFIGVVAAIFILIAILIVGQNYFSKNGDKMIESSGLNSVNEYPSATIKFVNEDEDMMKTFVLEVEDPSSQNPLVSVYYAPVINYGFQDSWTKIYSKEVQSGAENMEFQARIPNGNYWVMVNVNDNLDQTRKACTGNPTYSNVQLEKLNLVSCGGESYVELNRI